MPRPGLEGMGRYAPVVSRVRASSLSRTHQKIQVDPNRALANSGGLTCAEPEGSVNDLSNARIRNGISKHSEAAVMALLDFVGAAERPIGAVRIRVGLAKLGFGLSRSEIRAVLEAAGYPKLTASGWKLAHVEVDRAKETVRPMLEQTRTTISTGSCRVPEVFSDRKMSTSQPSRPELVGGIVDRLSATVRSRSVGSVDRIERFSTLHGISTRRRDDWFDPIPGVDTPLWVDPFLVFADTDPLWSDSQQRFIDFFLRVAGLIGLSSRSERSGNWLKAVSMLHFREPREFSLGLSIGHSSGSGVGMALATNTARAVQRVVANGGRIRDPRMLPIICENIGFDRASDLFCNVLKREFISYTRMVGENEGLSMKSFNVDNAAWGKKGWRTEGVKLPAFKGQESPVLLVPNRFLSCFPIAGASKFYDWCVAREGAAALRAALSGLVADKIAGGIKLTEAEKNHAGREFGLKNPDLVDVFLRTRPSIPYDMTRDSLTRVQWLELGREAAQREEGKVSRSADHLAALNAALDALQVAGSREYFRRALWPVGRSGDVTEQWRALLAIFISERLAIQKMAVSSPLDIGTVKPIEIRSQNRSTRSVIVHFVRMTARTFKGRIPLRGPSSPSVLIVGVVFAKDELSSQRRREFEQWVSSGPSKVRNRVLDLS